MASCAALRRAALKPSGPLGVEGGQHKHHGGRRRGKGWLSSSHSGMEGHGCPRAASSAHPAGTGGPSASAGLPLSTHRPASPASQPTPQRQSQQETPRFSAFKPSRAWRCRGTGPPRAQAWVYTQSSSQPGRQPFCLPTQGAAGPGLEGKCGHVVGLGPTHRPARRRPSQLEPRQL